MRYETDWERWARQVNDSINHLGQHMDQFQTFKNRYELDKQIEAAQQLNDKHIAAAFNYTNLILVAGYAGFFAFWSTLSEKVPTLLFSITGLLILISLVLFISWELIKMCWGPLHMRKVDRILAGQKGPHVIAQYDAAHVDFERRSHRVWIFFLIPTTITGLGAACGLIGYFAHDLWVQVLS
ncbi:hypothetical protein KK188_10145 [Pseudomonas aeruginosa]|nr:hypothetical protein KK210_21345 [Pseudomonas aeruginosa]WCX26685.1 hypothetical protein KK188_10145 [Pseudomonas aeruginosa]